MARYADNEIDAIKQNVSLLRLAESQGYELKKEGQDYVMWCPFHGEETASMKITPPKNVKQGFYVGAEAVQLIDPSRKKYDAGLRRRSGVRYLTSDPIGGGYNTYGYANQSPAVWYDPNGQNAVAGAIHGGRTGVQIGGVAGGPVGAGIGGAIGAIGGGMLGAIMMSLPRDTPIDDDSAPQQCDADDPPPDKKNCEALRQSILATCAGLTGRKSLLVLRLPIQLIGSMGYE